jgi:hypothetical protein
MKLFQYDDSIYEFLHSHKEKVTKLFLKFGSFI